MPMSPQNGADGIVLLTGWMLFNTRGAPPKQVHQTHTTCTLTFAKAAHRKLVSLHPTQFASSSSCTATTTACSSCKSASGFSFRMDVGFGACCNHVHRRLQLDELASRRTISRDPLWLFCIQYSSSCPCFPCSSLPALPLLVYKFGKHTVRSLRSAHVHNPCRSLFRQPVKTLLRLKVACRSPSIRTTAQQERN